VSTQNLSVTTPPFAANGGSCLLSQLFDRGNIAELELRNHPGGWQRPLVADVGKRWQSVRLLWGRRRFRRFQQSLCKLWDWCDYGFDAKAPYRTRSMYMVASIPSTLPRLAARRPAFWKSVPQPAWISMRLAGNKNMHHESTEHMLREDPTIRTSVYSTGTHGHGLDNAPN